MRTFRKESVCVRHLFKSSSISDDALICHPTWIKYFNSTYKVNCVLLLTYVNNDLPVFGKIVDLIVLPDNSVFFYVNVLTTCHFDQHYHAFVVTENLCGSLVKLSSLSYPSVLHFYSKSLREDRNIYVVLKYGVSC